MTTDDTQPPAIGPQKVRVYVTCHTTRRAGRWRWAVILDEMTVDLAVRTFGAAHPKCVLLEQSGLPVIVFGERGSSITKRSNNRWIVRFGTSNRPGSGGFVRRPKRRFAGVYIDTVFDRGRIPLPFWPDEANADALPKVRARARKPRSNERIASARPDPQVVVQKLRGPMDDSVVMEVVRWLNGAMLERTDLALYSEGKPIQSGSLVVGRYKFEPLSDS